MYAGSKKVEPPEDMVDYHLCRYVYHCLPSELDNEDALRIERHLIIFRQDERAQRPPPESKK